MNVLYDALYVPADAETEPKNPSARSSDVIANSRM